jgi:hypothetical protein
MVGKHRAGEDEMALFERVAADFTDLLVRLDDLERDVAILVKKATGASWERIGEAAGGKSYQAALKRYVDREKRPPKRQRPEHGPEPTNAELLAGITEVRRLVEELLSREQ